MATIEGILGHTLEDLEKMTDDELLVLLGPIIELEPKANIKERSIELNKNKKDSKKLQILKSRKDELSKLMLEIEATKNQE
jgi:hypothetical protein